ncbi:MAG: LPS export ABC transporter periplasmic protein LptC [Termitinemataceae bacterium]
MKHSAFGISTNLPGRLYQCVLIAGLCLFFGCSFDYSAVAEIKDEQPDLTMYDVAYVRFHDGKPQVRMEADIIERYETQRLFRAANLRFEQFENDSLKPDAAGTAGYAQFTTSDSNAVFSEGVRIVIPSEDIQVEAKELFWFQTERILMSNSEDEVLIKKADGSLLVGKGFSAQVRKRSWKFEHGVRGLYQDDETGGSTTQRQGNSIVETSAESKSPVDEIQ